VRCRLSRIELCALVCVTTINFVRSDRPAQTTAHLTNRALDKLSLPKSPKGNGGLIFCAPVCRPQGGGEHPLCHSIELRPEIFSEKFAVLGKSAGRLPVRGGLSATRPAKENLGSRVPRFKQCRHRAGTKASLTIRHGRTMTTAKVFLWRKI